MLNEQIEKHKKLGLTIAYYRKQRGFSQEKLADHLGISRTHVSRIENADCAVSLDILFKISDVLQVPAKNLFDFRD